MELVFHVRTCRLLAALALASAPAPAWASMRQVLLESGPYALSIDGAGSAISATASLSITRPTATSRVHRVFASVSSAWGRGDPGAGCLEVDGIRLSLDEVEVDAGGHARFDDVTGELAAYLDALPVGRNRIPVEDRNDRVDDDGHSLIVVWEDPSFPTAIVSLSLGTVLTGNDPSLLIRTEPIDVSAPDFHVELGVGISFSASPLHANQVSEIDVNGATVATQAGGWEDGECADGGLYTLGGDGDGPDEERFDVTPWVADGSTALAVDLYGSTMDDFVFALWVWAPGTSLDCSGGPDADGDGTNDRCDVCAGGDDAVDADGDGVPDGCDVCEGGDDAVDADGDGVADGCDGCAGADDGLDGDGDGIADGCDVCAGADDGLDGDGDGVADGCDVCAGADDGLDGDGDGIADGCDVCPRGDDGRDTDADGIADACDACPGTDADGDGLPDACTALDWLSPKRGPVDGGRATTLVGVGFDPSCRSAFDGVAASTTFVSPTALSVVPPPHPAALVDVTVACARGEDTLRGGYTYKERGGGSAIAPEILRVLPNRVSVAGGDTVTAEGSGFGAGVTVTVDGTPAEVVSRSRDRLALVVPPHAEGPAAIEVTHPSGRSDTLEGALLYVPEDAPVAEEPAEDEETPGWMPARGCATAPVGGPWAGLLVLLALRRRRWVLAGLFAGVAGCSEYQFVSREPPDAAEEPALPPVALTGPARRQTRDAVVALDGSASYDPDRDPPELSWAWAVPRTPPGATVSLSDPASPRPLFAADTLGVYFVTLEVTDADGLPSANPAAQAVEVVPWEDLQITLEWDGAVDLDLHLLEPGGVYYGPGDCFFGNPAPDWGEPEAERDDPRLSTDDDGSGPNGREVIRLPAPIEGIYTVIAVEWNDRGQAVPADARVEVRAAGRVLVAEPVDLERVGDARVVGTLDWTTLGWAFDGSATTHEALGGPPFNE